MLLQLDDSLDLYKPPRKASEDDDESRPRGEKKDFYVKGGPWEQQMIPDTNNTEEFPSMCMAYNAEGFSEAPKMGWTLGGARVVSNCRSNNEK